MAGVCIKAVATFKLATVKDNLNKDQNWTGNHLRVIHTVRGEHFCVRDFSLVVMKFANLKKTNYKLYFIQAYTDPRPSKKTFPSPI